MEIEAHPEVYDEMEYYRIWFGIRKIPKKKAPCPTYCGKADLHTKSAKIKAPTRSANSTWSGLNFFTNVFPCASFYSVLSSPNAV